MSGRLTAICGVRRCVPYPLDASIRRKALWFGIALALAGGIELGFAVNWLASGIGIATLLMYLFLYTPLKQKTWWSTTVGAVPGAMPPLIGFAAAAHKLTPDAWALAAILFIWQFPHFYAIAWMYREDYSRAGIKMLPVVEPDGASTARQILLYSAILIPISLLPKWMGMTGQHLHGRRNRVGSGVPVFRRARIAGPYQIARTESAARLSRLSASAVRSNGARSRSAVTRSTANRHSRLLSISLLLALLLTPACTDPASKLPNYGAVPLFTMTDSAGHAFDSRSLSGKVWIVDFIYTKCPAECPLMTARMHKVQQQVKNDKDLQFVSISVDPQHDHSAGSERVRPSIWGTGGRLDLPDRVAGNGA